MGTYVNPGNVSFRQINDPDYTVIKPRKFAPYVGFTEDEVRHLCEIYDVDFESMKHWYDGYSFRGVGSIYNPNSVMAAIENDDFDPEQKVCIWPGKLWPTHSAGRHFIR